RTKGWHGPLAWDDIDDPNAQPEAAQPDELELKRNDRASVRRAEIEHLAAFNVSNHEIAARLNVAVSTVNAILLELRTGRPRHRKEPAARPPLPLNGPPPPKPPPAPHSPPPGDDAAPPPAAKPATTAATPATTGTSPATNPHTTKAPPHGGATEDREERADRKSVVKGKSEEIGESVQFNA